MMKQIEELIQNADFNYLKRSFLNKDNVNDVGGRTDYDEQVLVKIQEGLKAKISKENNFENKSINTIAGVDLAYFKVHDKEFAVCVIVIIDYRSSEILGFVSHIGEITQKYIPSCLAFREVPIFLTTNQKIKSELNIEVDLYMFDGNGYLHPRNMGLATHAGIIINKPTLGVAKSYFKVDDTNFIMPENISGATTSILIKGEVYGLVYRSHEGVKPIFISTGNYINLKTALNITSRMVTKESRIPTPTRYADILANRIRQEALALL